MNDTHAVIAGWPRPLDVQALPAPRHHARIRVYYEDTDAGGIVYHANYLRFFERVRSDWLRALGAVHRELSQSLGLGFVVRDMAIDFRQPARLDDLVDVDVRVLETKRATMRLAQVAALADGTVLCAAAMRVAAIRLTDGRPVAFPLWLVERILTD